MFSRLVFWNSVVTLRQMYTTQKSISDHMCEFVHMYEKEEENRLVLNPPLFCHTAWHLFIQLDLIISGNSQLTMCDISTQCMTIDESRHVKQLQMITDNIIASEYIPQHLIYSQNTSSSEPLWIHRPAAELFSKLHPYVTCLTLSLQNHRLILSFSLVFSTFSPACLNLVFLAFALSGCGAAHGMKHLSWTRGGQPNMFSGFGPAVVGRK